MNTTLLAELSIAKKWSTGGLTTLFGLGMTFIMLTLLILSILLLKVILNALEKYIPIWKEKIKSESESEKQEEIGIETNTFDDSTENTQQNVIDEETMSVIEESVKKYVANSAEDGKPHDRVKIVSVKEVNNG